MEQRIQKRIAKYLLAKVNTKKGAFFCYVQDLAKQGLGMTCNRELEIGEEIQIDLNVPQRKNIPLRGAVVWRRDLPVVAKNKYIIGVSLSELPEAYSNYIEELLKREYERRETPRFTDVLEVKNEDVLDLLDAAVADVSAKGLYIRTGKLLTIGQQLELKLCGPELGEPIFCLGEVMASFTCEDDNLDHPYGAGVRIISFAKEDEARFTGYIRHLDDLYKFHWPDKGTGEIEVDTGAL